MEREHIHIHIDGLIVIGEQLNEINKSLLLLLNNQKQILNNQQITMAAIDDLKQTVVDLQASIDAKQAQIADAIAAFEKTIADLTAQVGTGATPEQIQAVITDLTAAKADLEATPTA